MDYCIPFLIAVCWETQLPTSSKKKTKMTSKNSSIPPSQTGKDETRKSLRKNRETSARNSMTGENVETVTVEEISAVEACDSCGTDLSERH